LIGRWLLTRPATPRIPSELLLAFSGAEAAGREAIRILEATTAAAITVEQWENAKKFLKDVEEKLNEVLNDAFVKGLAVAGRCLAEVTRLAALVNILRDILSKPLSDIDRDDIIAFTIGILQAKDALNACIQGVPPGTDGGGGGEKKAA
jgi:hypothetical protein